MQVEIEYVEYKTALLTRDASFCAATLSMLRRANIPFRVKSRLAGGIPTSEISVPMRHWRAALAFINSVTTNDDLVDK